MAINTFNVTIPVGNQSFGPFAIPDDVGVIMAMYSNWPQANRFLAATVWVSVNGGNFQHNGGTNPVGGSRGAPKGTTDCGMLIDLPPGVNRQIRLDTVVAGGPVATTVTLTTTVKLG